VTYTRSLCGSPSPWRRSGVSGVELQYGYGARVRRWPATWVRVLRNDRLAFIGYLGDSICEGNTVRWTVYAPEKLIVDSRPPPFPPPMAEYVAAPKVFEFWWKQLDFVFGLPDPRLFPPLPTSLSAAELQTVRRYVDVAGDLAASGLINTLEEGFFVNVPDGPGGPEEIEKRFSRRDLQVGFAGLLRQSDSPNERAHFERVRSILWVAADQASDAWREQRLEQLKAWSGAVKKLHGKSINQLLRDRLVAEGVKVLAFEEEHTPEQLLAIYNYGDLIHWGDRSDVVAEWSEDEFVESDRRLAYLDAAAGLGHVYIGFGELARVASGLRATDLAA